MRITVLRLSLKGDYRDCIGVILGIYRLQDYGIVGSILGPPYFGKLAPPSGQEGTLPVSTGSDTHAQ